MSSLTTSSLLLLLMTNTKISFTTSPLGSLRDATKLSQHILCELWEVHHHSSVFDSVALSDQFIPHSLRIVILNNLHSANQGVTGMRFHANQCVYWPVLDSRIQNHQAMYRDCIRNAPSEAELS